ncbi:MAG: hypothetical protein LDL41_06690 [Coleofasciculus sp. S288]|nr:hypothetical protein [Coleofasciculus sp. S288]
MSGVLFDRQDIEVVSSDIDWNNAPPRITVSVRAAEPIAPNEVGEAEELLKNKMRKSFKLVFDVTPSKKVESSVFQPN